MDCCSNLSRYCMENQAVRRYQLGELQTINQGGVAFGPSAGEWKSNNLLLNDPNMRHLAGVAPLDRSQVNLMTWGPEPNAKQNKHKKRRHKKHKPIH